jgi:hypothetical protein
MGLFSDILANAKTFPTPSRVAQKLAFYRDRIDPAVPVGYGAADEEQTIAAFDESLTTETYTLTFVLPDGSEVVVGPFEDDDVATTVQTAVDSAMDGVIAGYAPGDIEINDEDDGDAGLDAGPLFISFTGDSVTNQPFGQTTIELSATPTALAAVPQTTEVHGQRARNELAALKVLGVITDATPPIQNTTNGVTASTNLASVPPWFVRELAHEAAVQEDNRGVYDAIEAILGDNDAPLLID